MDPLALLNSLMRRSTLGERTILEIDLDLTVLSAPADNPLEALKAINAPTMRALRDGLGEAATDPSVAGLILHVGTCPLTVTQADELGDALVAFGRHKPAWAYAESFGEEGGGLIPYLLASRATTIWLQPSGQLALAGVRAQIMLLRGVFDKVGIEPQFGQRHEYKSAANTYAAHEVTGPHQEMMQRIADSLTQHAHAVIGERRGLSSDAVAAAAQAGPLRPDEALERGLIDHIGYRDEVYAAARAAWSDQAEPKLRYVHRYSRGGGGPLELVTQRSRPAIAVVGVRGAIVGGRPNRPQGGTQSVAAAELVCQQLRAAARDPHVRAVVLRVDSPGGSYTASDQIRREVLQLRASGRPVVASMGDLAASGGYFVAMPADEIVANPSTLTGSIGVLAGKLVLTELKRKIGLVMQDVLGGPWADFMSPNQQFTEEHWAALNRRLDDIYADFTAKAAGDRGMELDVLEPLARGRVWTGMDAAERGLVDRVGGMALAIERAAALAGLRVDELTVRPVSPFGFLTQFRPAESSESLGAVRVATAPAPGVDGLIDWAAGRLGLAPGGALSLPFRIDLG